ncbi:hypothetical protein ACFW04_006157 [Cataglyphis niger]
MPKDSLKGPTRDFTFDMLSSLSWVCCCCCCWTCCCCCCCWTCCCCVCCACC